MRIVVGSGNMVKVDAVREVLRDYEEFKDANVTGKPVESGASEQPDTMNETIQGAVTRARNAFGNCDYSFGIESGLKVAPLTKTGYLEFTACAIFDGTDVHIGLSPAFECPPKVMEYVKQGMDLSEACHSAGLAEDTNLGQQQGIVGVLTKGRKTRKDYTKDAVIMAMIHIENKELY